ncbi:hypothetical protein CFP56_021866 [Quercus suber]|uniref:Prolamin-like domain-containing protein n=1 Tax=Quercus suber TaxID=58331 RepID=A0AAW0KE83_QUESU
MGKKSPNTALILLCVCLVVLVPTRLAQSPQIPELFSIPRTGGPSGANGQCLSSIVNIPGCLNQIFSSLINGQFSIVGSSCCTAITQIEENCLSKLFPSIHIFTPLLNNSCAQSHKGNGQVSGLVASKASLPGFLATLRGNKDIQQCWSVLTSVQGCLTDITNSLISGKISLFGPTCCKTINLIRERCWPKLIISRQLEQDIAKCWSSLKSIDGCIVEIHGSLSKGEFGVSGPACCKAITNVSDKCWPKMFPFNPLFPPLLKNSCARMQGWNHDFYFGGGRD